MEQFPDDYECEGQIDIWEWMEEKESQSMTREEALQRIVDNNFAGEYGFDLQILIDCMAAAREMILNSQFLKIPKGATNGDMIKAMFPNITTKPFYTDDPILVIDIEISEDCAIRCEENWLNSPYRKEQE